MIRSGALEPGGIGQDDHHLTRRRPEPHLSSALAPYICRYGVMWLAEDPQARHRSVPGTVVFTDLSGFTALSERLATLGRVGSEEMATQLDRVFTALLAEARDRGGSLVHFGGDALILLFSGPDHEIRGVAAAAAMGKALRANALMRTPAGNVRIGMSTGVWSGDVDLFLLGRASRQLLISGPAATGVAQLEAMATSGQILLSEETAFALPSSCVGAIGPMGVLLKRKPRERPWTASDMPADLDIDQLMPVTMREHILAGGGEPEHRSVTVAFIRWTGIDALLRDEGPERVAERLDELVAVTEDVTREWGVTFLAMDLSADGGKIMCAAGTPVSHEDDESRILHAMRDLSQRDPGGFGLRIGLQRGYAFGAAVGAPFRRTYTCIGDTVNTAARIMSQAKPGQVLATDDVLIRSKTLFAVEALPEFMAKGKALPLQPFAVGEPQGTRIVDDAGTMVGRDEELAVLAGVVESALAGKGGMVLVEAPPGMGKTKLIQTALAAVPDEVTVLQTTCSPHAVDEAYATARPLLLQALAGRTPAEVAPHLAPWAPLVAAVTGEAVPSTPEVDALAERYVTERLQQVVVELLELSVPGVALLSVDDTHWADQASVALLAHLIARRGRPWSAWLARRPEGESRIAAPRSIRLGPLSDEAAHKLVRAHSPVPLVPAQSRLLVERAAGNALFLRELARAAHAGIDDAEALPADLESVVAARLDRLAPVDRDVLRVASVIGAVVEAAIVEHVAPQATEHSVWDRLSEFMHAGAPGQHLFRHAMYREVAYAGLPFARRREIHAACGALIEGEHGASSDPGLLSLHYAEGGRWDKAWTWSLAAADRAGAAYASIEEVQALDRAIAAGGRGGAPIDDVLTARTRLARTARRLGDFNRAQRELKVVVRSTSGSRRALALSQRAYIASDAGHSRLGYRLATQGLAAADGPESRADLLNTLALMAYRRSRVVEARALLDEALELAPEGELPQQRADALGLLSIVASIQGEETLATKEHAHRIFLQLGDRLSASIVLGNLGVSRFFADDWIGAQRDWRQAATEQLEAGYASGYGYSIANLGELAAEQGDLAAATELLGTALEVATSIQHLDLISMVSTFQVLLLQRSLRLDEAEVALTAVPRSGDPELVGMLATRAAEQALLLRDPTRARPLVHGLPEHVSLGCRRRLVAILGAQEGAAASGGDLIELGADPSCTRHERGLAMEAAGRLLGDDGVRQEGLAWLRALGIAAIATMPTSTTEEPTIVRLSG